MNLRQPAIVGVRLVSSQPGGRVCATNTDVAHSEYASMSCTGLRAQLTSQRQQVGAHRARCAEYGVITPIAAHGIPVATSSRTTATTAAASPSL